MISQIPVAPILLSTRRGQNRTQKTRNRGRFIARRRSPRGSVVSLTVCSIICTVFTSDMRQEGKKEIKKERKGTIAIEMFAVIIQKLID
jgi:hypothetical protein